MNSVVEGGGGSRPSEGGMWIKAGDPSPLPDDRRAAEPDAMTEVDTVKRMSLLGGNDRGGIEDIEEGRLREYLVFDGVTTLLAMYLRYAYKTGVPCGGGIPRENGKLQWRSLNAAGPFAVHVTK